MAQIDHLTVNTQMPTRSDMRTTTRVDPHFLTSTRPRGEAVTVKIVSSERTGAMKPNQTRAWRWSVLGLATATFLALGPPAVSFSAAPAQYDIAADWRLAPNQANPSPVRGVAVATWSYLYGTTEPADRANYQLLPNFATNKFGIAGLQTWWGPNVSSVNDNLPAVGINASGHDASYKGVLWPAGAVLVHPWANEPVVVAFRSPSDGNYAITGGVAMAQIPNCGNGIGWALDRSGTHLQQGRIQPTQTADWSVTTHLDKYQRVFLVVSPMGSYACDSTLVRLTVTPVA